MSIEVTATGSAQLCASCKSFQWLPLPVRIRQHYEPKPPHETFLLLQKSADQGCAFCQFLWLSIIKSKDVTNVQVAKVKNDARLRIHLFSWREDGIRMRLMAMGAHCEFTGWVDFRAKSDEQRLAEKPIKRHIKRLSRQTIAHDLRELIRDQIQPWIRSCREQGENHNHCGLSGETNIVPTRLVDVGNSENNSIRLIEMDQNSNRTNHPYLILSYCWGQGNERAKTTSDNIESRLSGLSVTILPKTIRDAIRLTRQMGFQYLWVDAICIIQATEDDPGDFNTEAVRMRDYYTNAHCCIAASLAHDSSKGFLTERPSGRYPIQPIALKLTSSESSQSLVLEGGEDHLSLEEILSKTPLMKRGWYIQELMLSRRVVHWTFHGVFLQCQSSQFLEGSLEKWENEKYERRPPGNLRDVLRLPNDQILGSSGWCYLVHVYSKKALKYERDRIYAIHGVACLLVERLGAEYSHGIFRCNIAQGLAWSSHLRSHSLEDQPSEPVEVQFPTWSWASNCPVVFEAEEVLEPLVFISDDHPQRPERFPIYPGNTSLIEHTDPRLYIRAPLLKIWLRSRNNQAIAYFKDSQGNQTEFGLTYSIDMQRSNQPRSLYSSFFERLNSGVSVQCLLICRSSSTAGGCYDGLLVQEMSREGEKVYQRYGYVWIHLGLTGKSPDLPGIEHWHRETEEIVLV